MSYISNPLGGGGAGTPGASGAPGASGVPGADGATGPSGVAGASSINVGYFDATAGIAPAVDYATLNTRGIHHVLNFDDSADETIYFRGITPISYTSGNNITMEAHWTSTDGPNVAVWKFRADRLAEDDLDIDGDSWSTFVLASGAANAVDGKIAITSWSISHADFDYLSPGDAFILEVGRNAVHGNDNLTGDAELLKFYIEWT